MIRLRTLALSISLSTALTLHAQTAASPTPAGPTTAETVGFIQEKLTEQGPHTFRLIYENDATESVLEQTVTLDSPCVLRFDQTFVDAGHRDRYGPSRNGKSQKRFLVDLRQGDIGTVDILPNGANDGYWVSFKKGVTRVPFTGAAFVPADHWSGVLQTITPPSTFTLLNWSNETLTVKTDPKKTEVKDFSTMVGLDTLKAGSFLWVSIGTEKNGAIEAKRIDLQLAESVAAFALGAATQDTAERVAKALIHAKALCGASAPPAAKPQLF